MSLSCCYLHIILIFATIGSRYDYELIIDKNRVSGCRSAELLAVMEGIKFEFNDIIG